MAIDTNYSYWEIFYNPDIPLEERVALAAVSPIAVIGSLLGCESSKSSSLPSMPEPEPKPVQKNPIDEYVSQCDGVAKRMSEVAACGQFSHQTNLEEYPSSVSLYIPQDNTQQQLGWLLSDGQCMIKCAWAAPAEPKYNKTGGLCEYILRVSRDMVYSDGTPYTYNTTITTEQYKAYDYFEYCLGHGYLP